MRLLGSVRFQFILQIVRCSRPSSSSRVSRTDPRRIVKKKLGSDTLYTSMASLLRFAPPFELRFRQDSVSCFLSFGDHLLSFSKSCHSTRKPLAHRLFLAYWERSHGNFADHHRTTTYHHGFPLRLRIHQLL